MKSKLFRISAACLTLLMLAGTVYGKVSLNLTPPASESGPGLVLEPKGAIGPAPYIVQLSDPPLASYGGTMAGLAATNPAARGQVKVDATHPDSVAYLNYLETAQSKFVASVEQLLGRAVVVGDTYHYAFNGLSLVLTPEEAAEVARLAGVRQLQRNFMRQPDSDNGPTWIGAPGIWDGSSTGGLPGTEGEGIIVGIIDTGINMDSPSFADIGDDGYNHTNPFGSGNYAGWCNPTHPNYDPSLVCNDKLIGVYSHADSGMNPEDDNGHGSHTSSTAAGNHVNSAVLVAPTIVFTRTISGVAPHANIIHYDACTAGGCPLTALVEFIDQAILDGVDVINYSFSNTAADPWNDSDSLALLGAFDAGVFAATSTGDAGPAPGTIGSPANAPWVTAAGASSHNRAFLASLINMTGGNTTPPADMLGRSISAGYGPAAIVYAGAAPYNNPFCTSFEDALFTGQIVVCDGGGGIGRIAKGQNVLTAGGGGMVLADNVATSGIGALLADSHILPAVHITYADGAALKGWLATGVGHMATITTATINTNPAHADVIASFSSRGPNLPVPDVIKPDLTNPGASIYAAYRDPEDVNVLSGASMSSAHTAGAAALLRALHPEWSAAEIKSVLMSTAVTAGLVKDDGATPADPFDYGAGRVELTMAGEAGLVLDETGANMAAADPGLGGDPATLNLASLANDNCTLQCSWTRVLSSTVNSTIQWRASASEPIGAVITVEPDTFTLGPYQSQVVTITANVANAPYGDWIFGHVHLTPSTATGSVAALLYDNGPLVNYPGGNQDGYDVSAVQNVTLGMTGYGFNNDQVDGFRVADDFTVTSPTGWNVDQFTFYGYQTGSPVTSTFTALNYRVWDGLPGAPGSNVVFGDTTNRLTSTTWSEIYRTLETTVLTSTERPLMANVASAGFYLPPGTYWLDWQAAGTLGPGPFVAPITIQGQAATGNALLTGDDVTWQPVLDNGTNSPQGLPFLIEGSVAASIDIAPVHFPLAVVPGGGYLPAEIEIHTRRDAGSQLVEGLIAAEITSLQVSTLGLAQGTVTQQSLNEDPTNNDPYNNDGGTFYVNVVVPAGTARLIAEIRQTTAGDLDLYVGRDDDNDGPEASEEDCSSATSAALEYCSIANPMAGTYWVLVQNWDASANPPDSVTLETVAMAAGSGNLTVVGPTANPAGAPFDLRVYWNEPALDAGEFWLGQIILGTDAGNPANIGAIPVRLYRHEDDVTKNVSSANPAAGSVITYTVQVLPNITPITLTYFLTDTLPAALTLVPGSASASAGVVTEAGNSVRWTGAMAVAGNTPVTITYQATVTGCGNPITNSLIHNTDNPGSLAVTVGVPIAAVCAPEVSMSKTVGTLPGECATTDSLTLPLGNSGTPVVYCFTVTNIGGELFSYHVLSDTLIGPLALPSGGVFNLEPAAVFSYTQVYTIAQFGLIENCATWTATGVSGNFSDSDCATVEIVEATGVSLTSLGGDSQVALLPIMLAALLLLAAAAILLYRRKPA